MQKDSANHFRLLSAKLMFLKLSKINEINNKHVFKELKQHMYISKCKEKCLKKMSNIINAHHRTKLKQSIKTWFLNAFNFIEQNNSVMDLAKRKADFKTTSMFFYRWREEYFNSLRKYDNKLEAITQFKSILVNSEQRKTRRYINIWKKNIDHKKSLLFLTKKLVRIRHERMLKHGLLNWIITLKKTQQTEKYQALKLCLANIKMKQRVFYSWKLVNQEERAQRNLELFYEWKNKCEQSRKIKFIDRGKYIINLARKDNQSYLLAKVFNAFKYNTFNEKYEKAKERLSIETKRKEEYQAKLDQLKSLNETKIKYHCFRKAYSRYNDVIYCAIKQWRKYCTYKVNVLKRLQNQITLLHYYKTNDSFQLWKSYTNTCKVNDLIKVNEEIINDNLIIAQDIKKLDEKHRCLHDLSIHIKEMKLDRCINQTLRRFERTRFKQWKEYVHRAELKESSINILFKVMQRNKLKAKIKTWKEKVKIQRRFNYINTFLKNHEKYKNIVLKSKIFEELVRNVKYQQKAKMNIKRVLIRWQRNLEYRSISTWKEYAYNLRVDKIKIHIKELDQEYIKNSNEIEELNNKIENTLSYNSRLSGKLLTQAKRIICNSFLRLINYRTTTAFNQWREVVLKTKERISILKSCHSHWRKKILFCGFRKWTTTTFYMKRSELASKIDIQITENAKIKDLIEQEENSYITSVKELNLQAENLEREKEKYKKIYNNTINALSNRVKDNVIVDKRREILLSWSNYAKHKKQCLTKFVHIISKLYKIEGFAILRLNSYKHKCELKNYAKLKKCMKVIETSNIRTAFSLWRVTNYNAVTQSMFKEIKQFEESKIEHQKQINKINSIKWKKIIKIISIKRSTKIFTEWKLIAKTNVSLKRNEKQLIKSLNNSRLEYTLTKWKYRVSITKKHRKNSVYIKNKIHRMTKINVFESWRNYNYIQKNMLKSICKVSSAVQNLNKAYAFTQIQHFGAARIARIEERKIHSAGDLAYLLNLLYKSKLSIGMQKIKIVANQNYYSKCLIKRVFLRSILDKQRVVFLKWKINTEKIKLAYEINTEGDVAVEAERSRRRIEILKKFLSEHGHPREDIDEELNERRDKQNSLMRSFIIRCFFKGSEFEIIPKAFNQLKAWTRTRKLYRETCEMVYKYMNSDIYWAFKRWKHSHEDERKLLNVYSKNELIRKCVDDEHLLGTLQCQIQDRNDHINLQMAERQQLLIHFASGQKIAFKRCEYKLKWKPLRRAFLRWQKYTFDSKLLESDDQIAKTEAIIAELMKICKVAEERNKDLILENEELRQASLDGFEIAKAVQELTREREKLSNDLNSKNLAIKQLIDDNNAMSEKLSQF